MITEVENMQTAKALATMPQTVKSTLNFPLGSWFLYNFGSIRGRNWTIGTKPCNYWIQQDSLDFMSLNLVKYIDVGNTLNFQFKIIPTAKGKLEKKVFLKYKTYSLILNFASLIARILLLTEICSNNGYILSFLLNVL